MLQMLLSKVLAVGVASFPVDAFAICAKAPEHYSSRWG
jgi:hypothetical protein